MSPKRLRTGLAITALFSFAVGMFCAAMFGMNGSWMSAFFCLLNFALVGLNIHNFRKLKPHVEEDPR